MKIIAFYLPQFHAIQENDEWWGEGFTEWVNVKKGRPLFSGHDQPKVPLNNNYYNLLDDKTKEWQIQLAKDNGLYGFCFYHYWFDGKLMLQRPVEQYLANASLDFPFCLCWANPAWTKIWAGKGSEILIDQTYGDEKQWEAHLQYLLPYFKDKRYIQEDGKPLLIIYSPMEIPCLEKMLVYLRRRIVEEGFPGLLIAYQYYVSEKDDAQIRQYFDYCIRFQPIYALTKLESAGSKGVLTNILKHANNIVYKLFKIAPSDKLLKLRVSNYDEVWKTILEDKVVDAKYIPGAFVNWDTTPRRGQAGKVTKGATPQKFEKYLRKLIEKAETECSTDYIFVTAWNEWSEGSYLEPDTANGDAYLKAIKAALTREER